MKNFISLVLVAALAAGGVLLYNKWQANEGAAALQKAVKTVAVERRSIQFTVSAAGEIGPAEQVSVRPEINGRIATLNVDIGDKVRKDDVLFTLDDQELQNELESRKTDIDRAKLQLAQSERNFSRAKQLFDQSLISMEEYENFKTELELAKNSLERTQREMAVLDERLTKTKIVAPFDCTVLARPVSVGQAVSGSGGVGGGTEVLAIADLNEMIIQAHINQADVARLQVSQEVDVQVEAVAELKVSGKVERIAPQATIKNNIKGFLARILLRNVDPRIRPGMTANIKIPVASAQDVVAIPLAAVFTEYNQETRRTDRYVFVSNGRTYERRPVQIGLSDFFHAEVQQGLAEGELVCLEPPAEETIITIKNPTGMAENAAPSTSKKGSVPPKPDNATGTKPTGTTTTTTGTSS